MRYDAPLTRARFVRREKRFFVHAEAADGTPLVAHTNNTGRMTGCLFAGGEIWLSPAANPQRKLRWSLEATVTPEGVPVGVNTALANRMVEEALTAGLVPELAGFPPARREVRYGQQASRIDLLLQDDECRVWVEVKNVSLVEAGHGRFPDAPTARGRKHLTELMAMVAAGDRAALIFCSQRPDAVSVGPATEIDPEYGALLVQAAAAGVEIYGLGCQVSRREIIVRQPLDVKLEVDT